MIRFLIVIGPIFSGLEESKADVVGMFGLKWLVGHGVLPKNKLGKQMYRKLQVYAGPKHPHDAQKPMALAI